MFTLVDHDSKNKVVIKKYHGHSYEVRKSLPKQEIAGASHIKEVKVSLESLVVAMEVVWVAMTVCGHGSFVGKHSDHRKDGSGIDYHDLVITREILRKKCNWQRHWQLQQLIFKFWT